MWFRYIFKSIQNANQNKNILFYVIGSQEQTKYKVKFNGNIEIDGLFITKILNTDREYCYQTNDEKASKVVVTEKH